MDIRQLVLVFSLAHFLSLSLPPVRSEHNITRWTNSRQKRFLIFTDSGSTKFTISMGIPVNLQDRRKWRSFNLVFNFQFQYNMPHGPLYWWDTYGWKLTRSGTGRTLVEPQPIDLTAIYIYAVIEAYMSNAGLNGRQCLQRAICENAQVYKVEGLFERIYQRLLTPEESSAEFYRDAFAEGARGVDCLRTYNKCPMGDSIFDKFVQYIEPPE